MTIWRQLINGKSFEMGTAHNRAALLLIHLSFLAGLLLTASRQYDGPGRFGRGWQ